MPARIAATSRTPCSPSTRTGPGQAHPDHTAAGRAALDAYMPSKMELYHPEHLVNGVKVADVKRFFFFGGSERKGEIVIDIAPTWEIKGAATKCHASQFGRGRGFEMAGRVEPRDRALSVSWSMPIFQHDHGVVGDERRKTSGTHPSSAVALSSCAA